MSTKYKKKEKVESDNIWESKEKMKCKKLMIDLEVEVGDTITNASQLQNTCRKILMLNKGVKDCSSWVAISSNKKLGVDCCYSDIN